MYRRAAEQELAAAQYNLGVMYSDGRGVPQNDAEAVRLYRRAAEQGNTWAQSNLGGIHATGEGIPKDYVQAYVWSNIAAAQGNETAKENLEFITKNMSTADIAKAQELSLEYWKIFGLWALALSGFVRIAKFESTKLFPATPTKISR